MQYSIGPLDCDLSPLYSGGELTFTPINSSLTVHIMRLVAWRIQLMVQTIIFLLREEFLCKYSMSIAITGLLHPTYGPNKVCKIFKIVSYAVYTVPPDKLVSSNYIDAYGDGGCV